MGLRGPAPLPNNVLKMRGTFRKDRHAGRDDVPRFEGGAPSCPDWLSAEAKAEWRRQVKQLRKAGVIQKVDRAALAAFCEAWGEFVELRQAVDRIRAAVPNDSPLLMAQESLLKLVRVKNAAADRLAKLAVVFGFCPAGRMRLRVERPEPGRGESVSDYARGRGDRPFKWPEGV